MGESEKVQLLSALDTEREFVQLVPHTQPFSIGEPSVATCMYLVESGPVLVEIGHRHLGSAVLDHLATVLLLDVIVRVRA